MNQINCIDVRQNRVKVAAIKKENNRQRGSKFLKPSFSVIGRSYQNSWKK
jgi:hypothetical protein